MNAEALEAEQAAARFVANMPEGHDRDLCRLSAEVGYLRGTIDVRNAELRTARQRIAELESALRRRKAVLS